MQEIELAIPEMVGTWRYADAIACEVRIVRHHTLYGSGDLDDPPEVANDRDIECFYVIYGTPVGEPRWAGGGVALTLAEAASMAEQQLGTSLVWRSIEPGAPA